MFGIGTASAKLGTHFYTDLIGEDEHSWGLSHKGTLRHAGKYTPYCRPFRERFSTIIGLFFDGNYGTLTYFKDGVNLGVAFRGLNEIREPLYPIVSSTSRMCVMTVKKMENEFVKLQDRCKVVILKTIQNALIRNLNLPFGIRKYLEENEAAGATREPPSAALVDKGRFEYETTSIRNLYHPYSSYRM